MSPGLKQLLAGEEEPESSISIDIPTGSLRHSRHSSICSRMSTKKDNIRSPLTDEVFKTPPKDIKENEDTTTFSTFKVETKKENAAEQPESSTVDVPPVEKGNLKRKESFLKRLFSRKRSSSSVLHSPSPDQKKKKHRTKESSDAKTSWKEKATLQERVEFYQTAISVEVFDDDGMPMPAVSEEAQQTNSTVANSRLHTTTVEINSSPDLVANCQIKVDNYDQAAVKTVAESVAENVVNQAILAVVNDTNASAKAEDDKSLPQSNASTEAPKLRRKKSKESGTDIPVEEVVISHDRASASYSAQFVETVKDQDKSSGIKMDYDTSSESNESNTSDNTFGIKPMNIEEFENFGEDVDKLQEQRETEFNHIHHEKHSEDDSLSGVHLASVLCTPNNPPMDDLAFNQPGNGIPSTVVRAIHKDLQVLSESIDKDLDKLLNENEDQEDSLLKMDEEISSSVSDIALEKLEEAQVISNMPLVQSTTKVATIVRKENIDQSTVTPTESKSRVKRLSKNFTENDSAHTTDAATLTVMTRKPSDHFRQLSSNFKETAADKNAITNPSSEGKPLKKSSSIHERLKLFGEKNSEITVAIVPPQSNSTESPQQVDTKPPEMIKTEENDVVTPLKPISSASLRRSSLTNVDKFKLDGLKGEMQEPISLEAKKQKWRMSPLELANKPGSPVTGRRMELGSPLSLRRAMQKKHDPESLELFMNSANLDYLTKLHEKQLDDAKMLAITRAEAILEDPTLNERMAPEAFKEVLSQKNNKFIWCVKDTWYSWLEPMDELPLELDSEDCYMLLHVRQ